MSGYLVYQRLGPRDKYQFATIFLHLLLIRLEIIEPTNQLVATDSFVSFYIPQEEVSLWASFYFLRTRCGESQAGCSTLKTEDELIHRLLLDCLRSICQRQAFIGIRVMQFTTTNNTNIASIMNVDLYYYVAFSIQQTSL